MANEYVAIDVKRTNLRGGIFRKANLLAVICMILKQLLLESRSFTLENKAVIVEK